MSAHCTIQTGRPALFSGLTLASGVGVIALGEVRTPLRLVVLAGGAAVGGTGGASADTSVETAGNRRSSSAVSKPITH